MTRRSPTQNNAVHLYFERLANALNDAGIDQKAFFDLLPPDKSIPIPWTKEAIKELWRLVQKPMTGKKSTTELSTGEVSRVYEVFDQKISELTGVREEFPHEDVLNK